MLASLFRRLTAHPDAGAPLFGALTSEARKPHWYIEGTLPDTMDGRFAVLATLTAMAMVRLEEDDDAARLASVALTERFVHVMESEHREMGLGDPGLGRQVRRLVGSLARRIEIWRAVMAGHCSWEQATKESLYKVKVSADALAHSMGALENLWSALGKRGVADLAEGRLR